LPRTCTVCRHQHRNQIDTALIDNGPLRTIADRYGISKTSLLRHRATCLPAHLVKAKEQSDVQSASSLVKELRELTKKTSAVLTRALRQKDGDLALKAIARLERQLELKARLLGELEEGSSTTIQHIEVHYVDKAVIVAAPPVALPAAPERSHRLLEPGLTTEGKA
jgi:hypothetical protein